VNGLGGLLQNFTIYKRGRKLLEALVQVQLHFMHMKRYKEQENNFLMQSNLYSYPCTATLSIICTAIIKLAQNNAWQPISEV